ncbi:MAG: hypothetical protein IKQ82_05065 [Lentisphaeria bacterium]|nr:hypothetical protein [Lentisphaeria bacterium]
MKTILLRKDWMSRPILAKEDVANGLPAGYERFVFKLPETAQSAGPGEKVEAECAEKLFLTSMCLQILRVKHRRIVAFIRPNELWLEPMPDGLAPAFPGPENDPERDFFLKALDVMGIVVEHKEDVRCLPDGSFYLPLVENGVPMKVFLGATFEGEA